MPFAAPETEIEPTGFSAPENEVEGFSAPDATPAFKPLSATLVNQPSQFSSGLPASVPRADNPDYGFTRAVAEDPKGFLKSLPGDAMTVAGAPGALAYNAAADTISKVAGQPEYGGNLAAMQRGEDILPAEKFIAGAARTNPKLATTAFVAKALPEFASMMVANPAGAAGRLLAAGFSADMIAEAKPMFDEYATEINKPPEEQDAGKIAQLKSGILQTFAFAPLAGAHGVGDFGMARAAEFAPRGTGIANGRTAPKPFTAPADEVVAPATVNPPENSSSPVVAPTAPKAADPITAALSALKVENQAGVNELLGHLQQQAAPKPPNVESPNVETSTANVESQHPVVAKLENLQAQIEDLKNSLTFDPAKAKTTVLPETDKIPSESRATDDSNEPASNPPVSLPTPGKPAESLSQPKVEPAKNAPVAEPQMVATATASPPEQSITHKPGDTIEVQASNRKGGRWETATVEAVNSDGSVNVRVRPKDGKPFSTVVEHAQTRLTKRAETLALKKENLAGLTPEAASKVKLDAKEFDTLLRDNPQTGFYDPRYETETGTDKQNSFGASDELKRARQRVFNQLGARPGLDPNNELHRAQLLPELEQHLRAQHPEIGTEIDNRRKLAEFSRKDDSAPDTARAEQDAQIVRRISAANPGSRLLRGIRAAVPESKQVGKSGGSDTGVREPHRLQTDLRPDGTGAAGLPVKADGGKHARGQLGKAGQKTLRELERIFGVRIIPVESADGSPAPFNGFKYRRSNAILLDAHNNKPLLTVAGHELLHHLQITSPALYKELLAKLAPLFRNIPEYVARMRERGDKIDEDTFNAELTADFTGDNFTKPEFLKMLADREPQIFKRFARLAVQWLDKLIAKAKALTGYGVEQHITDLEAARGHVADALARFAREQVTGVREETTAEKTVESFSRKPEDDRVNADKPAGSPKPSVQPQTSQGADHLTPSLTRAYELGKSAGIEWDNNLEKFISAANHGDADLPPFYDDLADPRALFFESGLKGLEMPKWVRAERIGKLPDKTSTNFAEQRREPGVSVLRLKGQKQTDNGTFEIFNPGKIYQVEGWQHYKTGSDGEPLLVDPKYSDFNSSRSDKAAPFSRKSSDSGDFFSAPESVADQKARLADEKRAADEAKAKLAMQAKAARRLTGADVDTNHEMFGGAEHNTTRTDKSGQMGFFSRKPGADDFRGTPVRNTAETRRLAFDGGEMHGPGFFSLKAHHGTPHDVDKFSTDKIGTGEGAQVYGWGLYFAENPKVAEDYAKNLGTQIEVNGRPMYRGGKYVGTGLGTIEDSLLLTTHGDVDAAIAQAKIDYRGEQLNRVLDKLENVRGQVRATGEGKKYTVALHVEPEDLMDWDKPLSEQSEKVQAAFRKLVPDSNSNDWLEGREMYDRMADRREVRGSDGLRGGHKDFKAASENMAKLGIKGIRYLDQGSRGVDTIYNVGSPDSNYGPYTPFQNKADALQHLETVRRYHPNAEIKEQKQPQTSNYVIFNGDDIEITHKNGEPVKASDPGMFSRKEGEAPPDDLPEGASPANKFSAIVRDALDLPERSTPERQSREQVVAEAEQRMAKSPALAADLVDKITESPRELQPWEQVVFLKHVVDLKKSLEAAREEVMQAKERGNPADEEIAVLHAQELSDKVYAAVDAFEKSGTPSARSLQFRNTLMREDYSVENLELGARAARGGERLTESELAKIKEQSDEIHATQQKIEDEQKAQAEHEAEDASVHAHAEMVKQAEREPWHAFSPEVMAKAQKLVDAFDKKADESRAALKKMGIRFNAGIDPTALFHLARIGAAHIARFSLKSAQWADAMVGEFGEGVRKHLPQIAAAAEKVFNDEGGKKIPKPRTKGGKLVDSVETIKATIKEIHKEIGEGAKPKDYANLIRSIARRAVEGGMRDRNALVDAVHNVLKDKGVEITRNEVRDAISGYGDYRQLSKAEVDVELRRMRAELQKVAQIEALEKGQAPLKSGMEHGKLSDDARRMVARINQLKKELGISISDPETQLKSALASKKTRLNNQIRDLEHEIATREKIVREHGATPTDPETEALTAKRDALKKERDDILKNTDSALAEKRAALEASIAHYQGKLDRKDFSTRPKPQPNPKLAVLAAQKKRVFETYRAANKKATLARRPFWVKAVEAVPKFIGQAVLSSPVTLAKLAAASATHVVLRPIDEAVGAGLNKLPMLSGVSSHARTEGAGFSPSAYARALAKAATQGVTDARRTLNLKATLKPVAGYAKGVLTMDKAKREAAITEFRNVPHTSDLDEIYGKAGHGRDSLEFFGLLHGAEKAPLKRFVFEYNYAKGVDWAERNGLDARDPIVAMRIGLDAYKQAQRALFLEDNRAVAAFQAGLGTLARPYKTEVAGKMVEKHPFLGTVGTAAIRANLPVVKVAANVMAQAFERAGGGLPMGFGKILRSHFVEGLESMPEEAADQVMGNLKRGLVGSAFMLFAFYNYQNFGGFYQSREKRKPGEVKADEIQIGGHNVPQFLLHNPLFIAGQAAATARKVAESKLRKKDTDTQGDLAGLQAAALGILQTSPFTREAQVVGQILDPHTRQGAVGRMAQMAIPQALQAPARWMDENADGEVIKRTPTNVWQSLQMGIPGMRQNVPEKKK